MRLVLLGKTGVGKSATGNTILGKKEFISEMSGGSVTTHCRVGINEAVRLVDTPGFFDTNMSNDDITKEIVKCVGMSAPGAHAFIVVLNCSGRFTPEESATVDLIKRTFGQEILKYMIVLFVGKDRLKAEGQSVDEYVNKAPDALKQVLSDCHHQYFAFDNKAKDKSKKKQSRELLNLVESIVHSNGGECYTDETYEAAEKIMLAEEEKRMREVKEKKYKEIEAAKQAIIDSNASKEKELRKRIQKLQDDIENETNAAREQLVKDVEQGHTFFEQAGEMVLKFAKPVAIVAAETVVGAAASTMGVAASTVGAVASTATAIAKDQCSIM